MMLVPRVLEKVALGIQEKFSRKNTLIRMMVSFFTMIAKAKNKHKKIAKGQVIGSQPNVFRRFFSRCVATALTPLDAIGHMIVWSKVKSALGELLSDHHTIFDG